MALKHGVRRSLLHIIEGRPWTMGHYAGIDVSLESASLCVVDATGRIVREAKVASEPEILIGWFRDPGLAVTRIGLEAGPLSQWLYAGMRDAGLTVELLETRHVRDAFKAMPVKTDRKDARGIAQLMRLGWFRPVHCKSLPAREVRALLTARKLLQTKNHDVEMCLRGVLRGFGLKVGKTTPRNFAARIRELVVGHATLSVVAEALLAARGTLFEQWQKLEKRLRSLAREDRRARLLMTAPGVGTIVALTYASAIDDPARFRSSKTVGALFGLTPRKYQSGETDVTGRISKIGDGGVRTALYEAANVILTRPVKGSALKSWGMRGAARAGMRKAKVALARKPCRRVAPHAGRRDELSRRQSGCDRNPLRKGDRRSRRRDDGSGQAACYTAAPYGRPRSFRLADLFLIRPIRWRPGTDPGQKQDTGGRIMAQRD
jgi:transposase